MPKQPKKPNGGRYPVQNRATSTMWESRFECRKSDDSVELMLYGNIGGWFGEITANNVARELKAAKGKNIRLRLNTPGGDVFEATAIHNLLKSHDGEVEASVDGIVASAGVHLMQGADKVTMASNAMLMIHNPWSIQIGDAADMRKHADTLDKVRDTIITTYQEKSGLEYDELAEMMDEETWMTATEAKDKGFIDAISGKSDSAPADGEEMPDSQDMKNQLGQLVASMRLPANSIYVPDVPAEPVSLSEEDSDMNPKLKAALFARDMIEKVDASDEVCQAALKGYFRNEVPETDAAILKALNGEVVATLETIAEPLKQGPSAEDERNRIKDVMALAERAGFPELAAKFRDEGTEMADAQAVINDKLIAKNQGVADDEPEDHLDPDAAYDEAFNAYKANGGIHSKEDFINSRKIASGELDLSPSTAN